MVAQDGQIYERMALEAWFHYARTEGLVKKEKYIEPFYQDLPARSNGKLQVRVWQPSAEGPEFQAEFGRTRTMQQPLETPLDRDTEDTTDTDNTTVHLEDPTTDTDNTTVHVEDPTTDADTTIGARLCKGCKGFTGFLRNRRRRHPRLGVSEAAAPTPDRILSGLRNKYIEPEEEAGNEIDVETVRSRNRGSYIVWKLL